MMKKLFKNKSFVLLFQGSLVSAIGTSLYGFAAGLYVQDMFGEDGGAIYLSLFLATSVLVRVVASPFAGALVDKWNKVRIIYMTDFIRGVLFLSVLYVLTLNLSPGLVVSYLLFVTALSSLNQALFFPATTAAMPEIVGEDMLQSANGANSIIQSVQIIFGVIAGMILYEALGFEIAVLVNAISFMFSGLSEMFIRTKFAQKKTPIKQSFFSDIKEGFHYISNKEGLLVMMICSLFLNFAATPFFSIGMPYLFRTELNKSAYHLGTIDVVFSITMLISGIIVGGSVFKSLRGTVQKGIVGLTVTFALSVIAIYLVTYGHISYVVFYASILIIHVAMAVSSIVTNVPLNTAMVKSVDPQLRGRVFSTIGAMSQGLIPLSMILGGMIADSYNVATLGIVCTVIMLVPVVGFLKLKKIQTFFNQLEEPSQNNLNLEKSLAV